MSRATSARRIATAAAVGGGGLGVVGALGWGLLAGEAVLARRWIGEPSTVPPDPAGTYGGGGRAARASVLQLAVLGDSSAAGLGADGAAQTPGALIASGVAAAAGRPVRVTSVAVVGATSADLGSQVDRLLVELPRPDVAVVLVGANDVTHLVRPPEAVRALAAQVRRLQAVGAAVVVGTCPDLGTIELVAQPLRSLARRWSRQMAAAQTIAVVEAGGRTVSLADLLGPEFAARPGEMFSSDRFHPSAAGYARVAQAMLPTVCAALGVALVGSADERPTPAERPALAPVAQAAASAADVGGTEVAPVSDEGREGGPRGRWAVLRLRRRLGAPAAAPAEPDGVHHPDPRDPETCAPEEASRA